MLISLPPRPRKPTKKELQYLDLLTNETLEFPDFSTPSSISLSVIVPAYNETERLGIMLDEACAYLLARVAKHPKFTFEIIIVDDGSKDQTTKLAQEYGKTFLNGLDFLKAR